MRRLFRQFSTPGGIPSHVSVPTPGSIHEGGELGYVLVPRLRRGLRQPGPASSPRWSATARRRPGRWRAPGRASASSTRPATARCCRSCTSTATRSPARPCWAATRDDDVRALLAGHGYEVALRRGRRSGRACTRRSPRRSTRCYDRIRAIQDEARAARRLRAAALAGDRAAHPEGLDRAEGGRRPAGRGHVPRPPGAAGGRADRPGAARACSRSGCAATSPEELFDADGRLVAELAALAPRGRPAHGRQPARQRRQAAGRPRPARLPRLRASTVEQPADRAARVDPPARQDAARHLRPQRRSRRTSASSARTRPTRTGSATSSRSRTAASSARRSTSTTTSRPDGRVMEVLSEHLCEGWLEGYLLTGRHGLFATYEAFAMVSASMTVQHTKWLQEAIEPALARRRSPSLNILLTSTCWRNDHNGFSHQGPGLIDVMLSKTGHGGAHLPAARRQLPALGGRPLPAQPQLRQPDRDRQAAAAAVARHGRRRSSTAPRGASIWQWASNDEGGEPDVVLAAPATSRPWRRWPRRGGCARTRPGAARCAWSTWST